MISALIKKLVKKILKLSLFKPILRIRMIERRLENTSAYSELYPEGARALRYVRYETDSWKATNPDWRNLLKENINLWNSARAAAENGPKILIATSAGGFSGLNTLESMLAVALTLRGAQVHILLCDEHLPGCFMNTIRLFPEIAEFGKRGPHYLCNGCYKPGFGVFQPLNLAIHRHSEFISRNERREACKLSSGVPFLQIPKYRQDGIAVGDEALASTLHFFARGTLDSEQHCEPILRRYFLASLLSMYEIRRLLKTYSFSCVLFHHGIYVPHGLFSQVARRENVRVVAWAPAYRKQTFIFSHHDTYHHTMLSEPTAYWENMPWSREMENEIFDYLNSRRYGTRDWISYQDNTEEDLSIIAAELGVDFSKPCIGMLTNVLWDAAVNYPANAFPNMVEWALQTIRYFISRPDLQLIIRVHPAEVQHPLRSRQLMVDEINRAFPKLPANIFIIPPDKTINTYAVMSQCDTVLIYATKTGLELACMGIPVVVAGDGWARNKGITLDATSPEEYFKLLDQLPLGKRLAESVTQRARKYAYHFFFRRMIPLPYLMPPWPYTLELSGLDDLLPGRSIGLDGVCDGILKGKEFIYPYESHPKSLDDWVNVTSQRKGPVSRVGAI
jgi:hypothetical protein